MQSKTVDHFSICGIEMELLQWKFMWGRGVVGLLGDIPVLVSVASFFRCNTENMTIVYLALW